MSPSSPSPPGRRMASKTGAMARVPAAWRSRQTNPLASLPTCHRGEARCDTNRGSGVTRHAVAHSTISCSACGAHTSHGTPQPRRLPSGMTTHQMRAQRERGRAPARSGRSAARIGLAVQSLSGTLSVSPPGDVNEHAVGMAAMGNRAAPARGVPAFVFLMNPETASVSGV